MNKIVQFVASHNDKYYLKRVEKALGYKLYPWIQEYILDKEVEIPQGRNNGKTQAVIIKFILNYEADPVDLRMRNLSRVKKELKDDPDIKLIKNAWLIQEIKKTYDKLLKSGLKLRKIKFPNI